jgi:hypothetical protein
MSRELLGDGRGGCVTMSLGVADKFPQTTFCLELEQKYTGYPFEFIVKF